MREKYKKLCQLAYEGIKNPFLPHQLKTLIAELIQLLEHMMVEIERLKGEQQQKEIKNHGDL